MGEDMCRGLEHWACQRMWLVGTRSLGERAERPKKGFCSKTTVPGDKLAFIAG